MVMVMVKVMVMVMVMVMVTLTFSMVVHAPVPPSNSVTTVYQQCDNSVTTV
jgi:hypothetical protein